MLFTNYLQVKGDGSPGYFKIVTSFEVSSLYVSSGSHIYVRYHQSRKVKLTELTPA